MAVWISISIGMTTGLDLEILLENSGLVSEILLICVFEILQILCIHY